MRKLILTFLLIIGSLFSKGQFTSDSSIFYPDLMKDSFVVHKNKYTVDLETRNDSTIVIIKSITGVRLESHLLLLTIINVLTDTTGYRGVNFRAKEIRLDLPEFVTLVSQNETPVAVAISDGESLTIWYVKRKIQESVL